LAGLLAAEVAFTLADFVVEDRTRRLAAGERVLHSVMAIVYGAMLTRLVPEIAGWSGEHSGLVAVPGAVPAALAAAASVLGAGIAVSRARDAVAASRLAFVRVGIRHERTPV
jgi:hypothetical protein